MTKRSRGGRRPASARKGSGWGGLLFADSHRAVSGVLAAGVGLFAVNSYLATTIQPSVTADIGGVSLYAWTTTIYVLAALIGSTTAASLVSRNGTRAAYRFAAGVLAAGTLACAVAGSMSVLLAGRGLQGLGGGLLFALAYIVVRAGLPETLWPRAMALVSAMFGVATVVGPAVGGAFAERGAWRLSFAVFLPLIVLFALAAGRLPRSGRGTLQQPIALGSTAILSAGVVAISVASASSSAPLNLVGMSVALACLGSWIHRERAGSVRLLPAGTLTDATPLRWYFITMALLAAVTSVDVFVPLFGQTLQGLGPLSAGYLAAVMSAGWTTASIVSSGPLRNPTTMMRIAPVVSAVGLAILVFAAPVASAMTGTRLAVVVGLTLLGAGVGMGWPHLLTAILTTSEGDEGVAGASITTVQMISQAFGTAMAGLVTNAAGLIDPGGLVGIQSAARWLFAGFLAIPAVAFWTIRQATRHYKDD